MTITKEIIEARRAQRIQQRDQSLAMANGAAGALAELDNALAMLAAPEPPADETAKSDEPAQPGQTPEPTPPEKTAHSP